MNNLNDLLNELGISKVRLAKYLGVSRQMLYNYLAMDSFADWPKEKSVKIFALLNIKDESELSQIEPSGEYLIEVENRLNEGVKDSTNREIIADLRGFNKKEQELITDIINLLKESLLEDKSKDTYNTYLYLYHYLQSMETNEVLKYILAYMSKAMGFTDAMDFVYNKEKQFIFEGIMFSAMTLYNNGGSSKKKIEEAHDRFVKDINQKTEEKLSSTQELNSAKVQALKELGYTEVNADNAKEVFEKIAEIQLRRV